jgi:hypothetical protein
VNFFILKYKSATKNFFFLQILKNKRTLHCCKRQLNDKHNSVIPSVVYNNVKTEKVSILKDNKGKTGVYRLTNLVNSKTYIGSANDLTIRF